MPINYAQLIEQKYLRWQDIYENGCQDPFHPDGVNLNLIRNHIIYYKRKLKGSMMGILHAELLEKPVPDEMPMSYMAKSESIRAAAAVRLRALQNNPDYQYLVSLGDAIPKEVRQKAFVGAVFSHVSGLERFILQDMLVDMRRELNSKGEESFARCAGEVRAAIAGAGIPKPADIPSQTISFAETFFSYAAANPLLQYI